ncbi:hypothetical protein DVS77_09680 [Mycolicibacterium moriokaense]|nr:hypothetical protein DVS77_09680 [Mycolicibacterium moriokaense]
MIMGKHIDSAQAAIDGKRLGGGILIGALASGAVAIGALGSAGQANATCVSAGGWFSIGSGCTTTDRGDFALAIGPGATASASGGRNTAIAWGASATATAEGVHNVAIGGGLEATALAIGGHDNTAIAIGNPGPGYDGGGMQAELSAAPKLRPTLAVAGSLPTDTRANASLAAAPEPSHNTAIAIGNGTRAGAFGGNNNFASAVGNADQATAVGGDNNVAIVHGNNSNAAAGTGPGGVDTPEEAAKASAAISRARSSNNVAIVRGNHSQALAGAVAGPSMNYFARAADPAADNSTDGNSAIVRGNYSQASAGGGPRNRARVFGNRSSARAIGSDQNVTSKGDDVHNPPAEK